MSLDYFLECRPLCYKLNDNEEETRDELICAWEMKRKTGYLLVQNYLWLKFYGVFKLDLFCSVYSIFKKNI